MSEQDEIVISVNNLSKDFKLPHQKVNSVKGIFTNLLSIGNKTFETQHALKDISFEIKKGEFFGIVGRNGSGKSTLLKILAGIYQPSKGKVSVQGRVVPFIELGVGFNGELSGRENVYLNGALLGFSEKEIQEKYQAIVDFAEIERFMDQKLKNYSSGMQVRLAFSVATVLAQSDVLLIDEVLAVGDADFQRKCFDYFKNIKKQGKTVIFVSHDMNAIREYCERAILIEKNVIIEKGSAEEVAVKYSKLFLNNNTKTSDASIDGHWGDGVLSLKSPKANIKGEELQLSVEVRAIQECDSPVIGFVIKNAAGVSVLGTNTKLERIKIPLMMKNSNIKITWNVPDIFSDGDYTVTLAAVHDGGATTSDWWEDATNFRVTKISRSPYLVAPQIKTFIKEIPT